MLDLVEGLGPTVLRYPGGSLSDTFDWRSGSGPLSARGTSEHFFTRQRQVVLFGGKSDSLNGAPVLDQTWTWNGSDWRLR